MLKTGAQQGQVALVVLLIMSVTLVIALSLAKGTTDETFRTAQKSETVRIFSAAESGAGYLLTSLLTAMRQEDVDLLNELTDDPDSAAVDTTIETAANADVSYSIDPLNSLNVSLATGQATEVQFVDAAGIPLSGNTTVIFRWAKEATSCNQASILIGRYYDLADGEGVRATYTAVGPNDCTIRNTTDGFETAEVASAGFANQYSMTFDSHDLFARVIPIYYATQLFASSADQLPIQQRVVRAEAVNQLGELRESQATSVTTTNLQLPGYLDYAVYSGQSLVK